MEILAIIMGLLLTVGIGWYIAQPLSQHKRTLLSKDADTTPLEVQRDLLYAQIRELDLDHATGKTNDEDHNRVRAELMTQAANLLRRIDGLAAAPRPTATSPDDEIEAAIAARRRQGRRVATATDREAELEAAIAARRSSASTLKCPNCGKPAAPEDAFCSKCGSALQPQATR